MVVAGVLPYLVGSLRRFACWRPVGAVGAGDWTIFIVEMALVITVATFWVGLDIYGRGRWVACLLHPDEGGFRADFHLVGLGSFPDFLSAATAVGIDVPLTFQNGPVRRCDLEARRIAPPATIFNAPALAVVQRYEENPRLDYQTLHALNRQYQRNARGCPVGLSKQSFWLLPYIAHARRLVAHLGARALEIHPEVSFLRLSGQNRLPGKRTPEGFAVRRELLAGLGVLGLPVRRASHADDYLDAAVAAFTAYCVSTGSYDILGDRDLPLYCPGARGKVRAAGVSGYAIMSCKS